MNTNNGQMPSGLDTKNVILRMLQQVPIQPGTWQQTVGPEKRYNAVSQL